MCHPKAGGPHCGRLWLEMVQFYCTGAKTTTKEENGKKRQNYASLGIGQSVLWRLLTHMGALVVLFYVLFVLGSQGEVLSPLP